MNKILITEIKSSGFIFLASDYALFLKIQGDQSFLCIRVKLLHASHDDLRHQTGDKAKYTVMARTFTRQRKSFTSFVDRVF